MFVLSQDCHKFNNAKIRKARPKVLRGVCLTILAKNRIFLNEGKWNEIRNITPREITNRNRKMSSKDCSAQRVKKIILASLDNNQAFYCCVLIRSFCNRLVSEKFHFKRKTPTFRLAGSE